MMQAVHFRPGGPENLYLADVPLPELWSKHVHLRVIGTAINRADLLQRKGLYPPPQGTTNILGLEATGVIERLAQDCAPGKWTVGDRVMALLPGGGNAEIVSVHEDHLMPLPKTMTFREAAAIPEAWLTAFQLLHFVGSASSSDTILIHAGGSGVGTAAIQLGRLLGAKIIVTAGTEEKLDHALELGAFAAFNYKEEDFSQKVLKATKGKGVNLILDCVGASFWQQNAFVLAMEGRWVLYGLLGGKQIEGDILATILRKRATLTGTTLRARTSEYKAKLIAAFVRDALPHFETKKLRPIIDKEFCLENIEEAHKYMESNSNIGKIVLYVKIYKVAFLSENDDDKDEL